MKKTLTLSLIIIVATASLSCMVLRKKPKANEIVPIGNIKIDENFNMNKKVDFKIESAKTEGDTLVLKINYKKTKGSDIFELIGNKKYMKSKPMKLQLFINHISRGETSEKDESRTVKFNIAPIKPDFEAGEMMYLALPGLESKVEYKLK